MRPYNKKKEIKVETMEDFWPPKWFFAYADLATLMMTFFLILATMVALKIPLHLVSKESEEIPLTAQETRKLQSLMELDEKMVEVIKEVKDLEKEEVNVVATFDKLVSLYKKLKEFIASEGLEDVIRAERSGWHININFSSVVLFKKGCYDLSWQAQQIADQLVEFIKAHPSKVTIEGHTDNLPIETPALPSNWELSIARANSFMRYFVEKHNLPADTIEAVGYGEHQPLFPNDTEEGRAANRRLVVKLRAF